MPAQRPAFQRGAQELEEDQPHDAFHLDPAAHDEPADARCAGETRKCQEESQLGTDQLEVEQTCAVHPDFTGAHSSSPEVMKGGNSLNSGTLPSASLMLKMTLCICWIC